MKKTSKKEAQEHIEEFFKNIKDKQPEEIKKIRKTAMKHNIKLGDKRKTFCKKCYSTKLKTTSTKKKIKRVKCTDCENLMRWKIK